MPDADHDHLADRPAITGEVPQGVVQLPGRLLRKSTWNPSAVSSVMIWFSAPISTESASTVIVAPGEAGGTTVAAVVGGTVVVVADTLVVVSPGTAVAVAVLPPS